MITINTSLGAQVLGFTVDGEIDREGINQFYDALTLKAEAGKVKLLGEIKNIDGIDSYKSFFDAIQKKIKATQVVAKYAIIGDMDWLKNISGLADFILPNIPIKYFSSEDRDNALIWLLQKEEAFVPGIKKIETDAGDNFLAYKLTGKITPQEYVAIDNEFFQQINSEKPLNLYLEFAGFEGYSSIASVWDDFKTGIKYYSKLNKIAIIGNSDWMDILTRVGDVLTPGVNIEYFSKNDKVRATTWLNIK
ncbi:STAS/SEC14 domain-containing protein [Flammeovirga pectinis]|uniref:STAS/SEC14 domain-containing protein n=1 Tax=Flammeovirga pectinis TaxID=2494373 RepID=A0A3Q9FIK0_9BACT|nr:STAS/SEC14 domain-containing protein [Flammeovirga pectinis]AZQ60951.1 STAS/SEC14 domain-containing protein [Flammeovirga pectinis]